MLLKIIKRWLVMTIVLVVIAIVASFVISFVFNKSLYSSRITVGIIFLILAAIAFTGSSSSMKYKRASDLNFSDTKDYDEKDFDSIGYVFLTGTVGFIMLAFDAVMYYINL